MRTAFAIGALLFWISSGLVAADPFGIQVVDADTGRGVPLVMLRTTSEQTFVTDSGGWVAIDEPDLLGHKVFFHVVSHGYEFPADGFGSRGRALDIQPGGRSQLTVQRLNIAERLYRVTGAGIYAESLKLGLTVPLKQPLLSGGVTGQDSVQAVIFADRVHWFWGDTNRLSYPLGQFRTSAALSELPFDGGLDPSVGVDLTYTVNPDGFSRPMFEIEGPGVVWLDGLSVVADATGGEHMVGHFSRREGLSKQLAHGLAEFDPRKPGFRIMTELPEAVSMHPQGQATRATDAAGMDQLYFSTPYPSLRVPAKLDAVQAHERYEALTPLRPGSTGRESPLEIERDAAGEVVYTWKPNTAPVTAEQEHKLIQQGLLNSNEAHWQTADAATGDRVLLHGGSVRWNAYRRRWVMIAVQTYGRPSFLGEVWYCESERIEGPWSRAVKIVTHDKYSYYNPTQHQFFDQDGGRTIYFEGTYTHTFSGQSVPTPRYDYNQVMYRLDLGDSRLDVVR